MTRTVQRIAEQHQRGIVHLGGCHACYPTAIGMATGDRSGWHLLDKHGHRSLGLAYGKVDRARLQLALLERLDVGPHAAGVSRGAVGQEDGWNTGGSERQTLTLGPTPW